MKTKFIPRSAAAPSELPQTAHIPVPSLTRDPAGADAARLVQVPVRAIEILRRRRRGWWMVVGVPWAVVLSMGIVAALALKRRDAVP